MFHSYYTNSKIEGAVTWKLNERTLQIVYNGIIFWTVTCKRYFFLYSSSKYSSVNDKYFKVLNNMTDNVYNDLFVRNNHDVSFWPQPDLIVPSVSNAKTHGDILDVSYGILFQLK